MPKENVGEPRGLLPIKLILPNQGRERPVPKGGEPPKPFRTVDAAYRRRLETQVNELRQTIASPTSSTRIAPMRVKLLPKASAKTHRPERLFSHDSCPIIGAGRLGEIFVKASAAGLQKLAHEIEHNTSKQVIKELSSIEIIEPVTPVFRRRQQTPLEILKRCPRGKKGFVTRVRLFDLGGETDQREALRDFLATCEARKLEVNQAGYSPRSYVYAVECAAVDDIEALSRTIGVRSISQMPLVQSLKPKMINSQPLPPTLPRAGEADGDFPVVVVIDSGVSSQNPALETWVVGRESYVSPQYRNTDHGTFVAGLVCWGSQLNPQLVHVSTLPCGVYDLQVMPNVDPSHGDIDDLTESEFLQTLETALDLTGVFCTSGSEREFTLKESWYAHEEIQAGADRDAAAAD